ncbi:MAG: response regulator transcription factor [Tannerellaceae bacterium]|jgi:DNA-binding NarL/FixJ family response regulator|nr:response regulator transcription factor [Tannerellaceae bacterium]
MRTVILADNQDITRTGMEYLCGRMSEADPVRRAADKKALIGMLAAAPDAVVVLDYTLFDLSGVEELLILSDRFHPDWILFSDELSLDLVRQVTFHDDPFSIVLKDSPLDEIEVALRLAILKSEPYICRRVTSMLSTSRRAALADDKPALTSSEWEILKLIALGKTTKEIAEERFSSTHTITTHRKNIFRKLDVNNVHEATKYALRAGIVDLAEYYI